jgi:exopolysaccharide production protein ExoZ
MLGLQIETEKQDSTRRAKVELFGIQMMRGVAAALVVLHHALEESLLSATPPRSPDWLTTLGASGVDIFFVISGFIMLHTSFPSKKPPLSPIEFAKRRLSRIYPFYWFCIILTLSLWSVGLYRHLDPTIWMALRSILLLPTDRSIIGVSWTLVYEMYFYFIFACALVLQSRLASTVVSSGTIGLLLGAGIYLGGTNSFLGNPIVLEFCFGMLLAYAFHRSWLSELVLRYGWVVGSAMLVLAPVYVKHDTTNGLPSFIRWAAWGIPALLIVASSLQFVATRYSFQKLLMLIGDSSYAIYLTHPFVMIAYAKVLHDHPSFLEIWQLPFVPVVFAVAIFGGILAHIFVERPLIDLARRWATSNTQLKPAGGASKMIES